VIVGFVDIGVIVNHRCKTNQPTFDKTQESDESESEIDDEVSGHVLIM
jgi:hypothetical protein